MDETGLTMLGLMQDSDLTTTAIITHAARCHGGGEIVSIERDGVHRTSYREVEGRARRLACALKRLGVQVGTRVGVLSWNDYRYLELYYAVPGIGGVLHTINPRLFAAQLIYMINHAEDEILFVDPALAGVAQQLFGHLTSVKYVVIMDSVLSVIECPVPVLNYENLVGDAEAIKWPEIPERSACTLCYTSGTTGNPKGVLYSHRSVAVHSLIASMGDTLGLRNGDSLLLVAPMFHANAWDLPYAAALSGTKLVLPSKESAPEKLASIIANETITIAAGAVTVWLSFLDYIKQSNLSSLGSLNRVLAGSAAPPRHLVESFLKDFDVQVIQAWGMTEMNSFATTGQLLRKHLSLSVDEKVDILTHRNGRLTFGVDVKITDDGGEEIERDADRPGHIWVKGPCVIKSYFGVEGSALDPDGWLPTGDIGSVSADGYMRILDRSKDVIKSGGEWISSVILENEALQHPAVKEAAAIAIPHPKWQERPLLALVLKEGEHLESQEVVDFLEKRIAKWWLPDKIMFLSEMPHTGTGKIQKARLREMLQGKVSD
jgi:fatty-acyl-CoA synthase